MEIKRIKINCKRYILRNYGDGWDVYYHGNSDTLELLEEGCSSFESAYKIAAEHSEEGL